MFFNRQNFTLNHDYVDNLNDVHGSLTINITRTDNVITVRSDFTYRCNQVICCHVLTFTPDQDDRAKIREQLAENNVFEYAGIHFPVDRQTSAAIAWFLN